MIQYYAKEREIFKDAYDADLTDFELRAVFERLKSHYKFRQYLVFKGTSFRGHCTHWEIRLPHDTSLGLLVHEVAHAIQFKKLHLGDKPKKWHTKKHTSIMRRILKYINGKGEVWISKANLKAEQRIQTVEKQELKAKALVEFKKTPDYKLQVIDKRIKQWETKKKRAESYLKKLLRNKKYWEKRRDKNGRI